MPITNGYCTPNEAKARMDITDSTDDSIIEAVITSVSRWIDSYCNRRFYTTVADETRYYTAQSEVELFPNDDIISITTLATDGDGDRAFEDTWTTADYDLLPANAVLNGGPYTLIAVSENGAYLFPAFINRGVKIVGKFGYASASPAMINQACLLQSQRIFNRKDSPFGIAGSNQAGGQLRLIPGLDPDVQAMLEPFVRRI